jgi:peptidoglycan/xylan/chitin deacetylase (PgdA/CDA1 family)
MTLAAATERRHAGKALVVSFDDACRSVLLEGFPVLSRLGVPATVFVPTSFATEQKPMAWGEMDRWLGTPFEPELDCMSWDELRQLQSAGWEIGSHTRSHRDLTSLADADLSAELAGSREECEGEMQRPCLALAYPFSSYDGRVKESAKASGYTAGLILDSQLSVPRRSLPGERLDPFELLRAGIYRHDNWPRFLAKTSRAVRRARASRPMGMATRTMAGRSQS